MGSISVYKFGVALEFTGETDLRRWRMVKRQF